MNQPDRRDFTRAMPGFSALRETDPPCYYSILQDTYIHQDPDTREWVSLPDKRHTRYLMGDLHLHNRIDGSLNSDDPVMSDVNWSKHQTEKYYSVEAAFDYDGMYQGEILLEGKKYLNTGGTSLPMPERGPFPAIEEALEKFFDDLIEPPLVFINTVRSWYEDILALRSPRPRLPIFFIGDSEEEGTSLHDFYALLLGGRSTHYAKADSLKLLASSLWRLDRNPAFSTNKPKSVFFDLFLSREEVEIKIKGNQVNVPCHAQKSVFLVKDSLFDLWKTSHKHRAIVLPCSPLKGWRFDAAQVIKELPAFMAYLVNDFRVPENLRGRYVDPTLEKLLFVHSPTGQFYAWLLDNSARVNGPQTLRDLQQVYSISLPSGELQRDIFRRDKGNIPFYLETLSARFPEQISKNNTGWRFNLPTSDEPSQFDDNR